MVFALFVIPQEFNRLFMDKIEECFKVLGDGKLNRYYVGMLCLYQFPFIFLTMNLALSLAA